MRKKSELRPYQQRVVTHLYENDEVLAVLKMGAGKTISTLTAIAELVKDKVIRHALIVAPKRVATIVWPAEIEAWEHTRHLKYAVLDGTPEQRRKLLGKINERQLTIIGIDNLQWLVEELKGLQYADHGLPAQYTHMVFDCLVIDETSRLKDPKSKRGKALATISPRFRMRWGLTGTPAPNSLMDLFTPMKILTNGTLWGRSFYKWQRDNFYPTDFKGYRWQVHQHREQQLLADAASVSIALGEGEMPDLPDMSILIDEVRLPPPARRMYDDMERRLVAQLGGEHITAQSMAVAMGKCAQIANGYLYDEEGFAGVQTVHDEKSVWLKDLVEDLNGEPTIVVYEFQEDLAILRRLFGSIPYLGHGVSDKAANQAVEDWNAGKLPLFALHPASGGHGLNLQHGGSRMAWMAPTWSAELWDQTIARIHRPGQAAHVMVHVCMATGTVDDLKRLRVISKLSAQQAFEAYLAASRAGRRAA